MLAVQGSVFGSVGYYSKRSKTVSERSGTVNLVIILQRGEKSGFSKSRGSQEQGPIAIRSRQDALRLIYICSRWPIEEFNKGVSAFRQTCPGLYIVRIQVAMSKKKRY